MNTRSGTRRRTATMADVAGLAGVSPQTVSRVVNDSGYVGRVTRERVLAAMRELSYRPNSAARALVTGRSNTLGVVSIDTTLFGPASILLGVERAAHAHGYFVSIASLESLDGADVVNAVERLERQNVEGILINAGQGGIAHELGGVTTSVPIVALEEEASSTIPIVAVDQFTGAVAATRLLLDLGHSTVWHIAGPADWDSGRRRLDGWRTTLQDAGVAPPPPLFGDWSPGAGYELGRQLAADPDVTAIFVANDQMALGVLRALHLAGREVPRDISVIGFDDIPEARYLTPPLTTVRQDFDEVGRQSLLLLLQAIDPDAEASPRVTVTPELIVRESTGSAPRSAP
jgi:DNA-binding LacI/PurR family transcriptional regulator